MEPSLPNQDNPENSHSEKRQEAHSPTAVPTQNPKIKTGNDNTVFIGNKRLMNYVNSIGMQFKNSPEVVVKARGKFISKAVDIVEVARRQEQANMGIKNISIGTEEYENEGKKIKVSTIDITLGK